MWATVRDFGASDWVGAGYTAVLEEGRGGDAVGTVRRVGGGSGGDDGAMRQRLVALSDVDRSFTYDVLPGSPIEVDRYRACLRVRPVVDSGRALVEWSASFDCPPEDADRWRRFYAEDRFPTWRGALRERLTRASGPA